MGGRTFTDSAGIAWQVWEVHPEIVERRSGGDRRGMPAPDPVIERRGRPERRVRRRPRGVLRPEFERGWLCFDAGMFRRRLAPIPPCWEECSDTELEALCGRAERGGALRSA